MKKRTQKKGQEILFSVDNCQPYQIAEVINHHRQAMSRFFPWHFHENALFT